MPWCFKEEFLDSQPSPAMVVNLSREGTHWVAARKAGNTLFYADPFGSDLLMGYPPKEMKWPGVRVVTNRITWQRPSTNYCGYYSALFTKALDSLNERSTQKEMEEALMKYIR